MDVGTLIPLGEVKANQWDLIYETTLTDTATSVTISGLDGNTDEVYKLNVYAIGATDTTIGVRYNNLSAGDYGYCLMFGNNTAVVVSTVNTDTYAWMGYASNTTIGMFESIIYAETGYPRLSFTETNRSATNTTVGYDMIRGGAWLNSATNITSMVVYTTSRIESDSYIALYKKAVT